MAYNFKRQPSRLRSVWLLLALLLVSVLTVTVYYREGEGGPVHAAQNAMTGLFSPIRSVGGGLSAAEQSASVAFDNATADPTTLEGLKDQNEQLRQEIAKLEEYRQEAQRLQELLDLNDFYSIDGVAARVLSYSGDSWNKTITLNRGSDDGIRPGLPVIGPNGLIGQVIRTSGATCEVRLITDPSSGVAVIVQSSRAEGVAKGSFDGYLYLENLDDDAKVQVGDVIITSGSGGEYTRGIIVGTVVKIEGSNGSTSRKIVVQPNDQAKSLGEVIVVKSMNSEKVLSSDSGSDAATEGSSGSDAGSGSGSDSGSSSSAASGQAGTGAASSGQSSTTSQTQGAQGASSASAGSGQASGRSVSN